MNDFFQELNWQLIWQMCLIASIGIFALMSIVVTIGGALDIRRMLKRLEKMKDE